MTLEPLVVEPDAALAVVVAHDEVGLRAMDRALIGPEHKALALARPLLERVEKPLVHVLAEARRASGHERRQHGCQAGRDRSLLDHHAVLEPLGVAQIDEAGDAGPDGTRLGGGRVADADAVDGNVVVVGEGQDVAVAGEALAELLGDGEARRARAQEDLGGAQRAGGEHDDIGGDRLVGGGEFLALEPQRLEIDAPAPALGQDVA